MNPLVSIVVPIYKVPEKYLRHCIESCINQTLKDIEIVLVDDGSPDNCGVICDEYAAIDDRIKVIHKMNGGLAAARNTGFDAVSGETMMFLDGDDFLELDCCECTYKILKKNGVELVMFDQIAEYEYSRVIKHSFTDNPLGLDLNKYRINDDTLLFDADGCRELQLRVLDFNGRIAMVYQKLMLTKMLRKCNIKHINELRQGMEGYVFNMQLYNHLKSACYISMPFLHYIYNTQSITHKPIEDNYYLCLRCLEWIRQYIDRCENYYSLLDGLYCRVLFLLINTAISCYFNPLYNGKYKDRVEKFNLFLNQPLVVKALRHGTENKLDTKRRIVLKTIQFKQWWFLRVLGWARKRQLDKL